MAPITLGPPEGPQEGCGDNVDAAIDRYLAALPQVTEGLLDDEGNGLVLTGNDVELRFERAN